MAGADEFVRNIDELSRQVGTGRVTAGCIVDQIYAQNQHQNLRFRHTNGRSHYLGGPLLENSSYLMMRIAGSIIDEGGSHLKREMINVAETLAGYVLRNAPRDPDLGDVLANSGSPYVMDEGILIYKRPPIQPREHEDHH
jgi:hypothetical protein